MHRKNYLFCTVIMMKKRPLLVLLLFVASAGILVWIYYASTREHPQPTESPWDEAIADLSECGRRKHVKSAQYDYFAEIADQEQLPATAKLFRAMAYSERIHEQNCVNAVVRFGGRYWPPTKVVVFKGKTDDNLTRSLAYERQHLQAMNGADITRAFVKGNRYAARLLTWATAGDLRHILLLEERIRLTHPQTPDRRGRKVKATMTAAPPAQTDSTAIYLVCPICGNTYNAITCDAYCPFCLTEKGHFVKFE